MSYFDLNRGALRPPTFDSRKAMPVPAVLGPIAGAGISAIGSIIGGNSAAADNYENQSRLIDKMNEYNTPVNQRARLEAAGLNPYLVSGGISPGNQQAAGDISAGTNARSSGYLAAANQVGVMAEQIANVRKTNAEANATEIDNQTRASENQLRVDNAKAQLDDMTFKIQNMNPETLRKLKNEADEVAQRNKNLILESDNLKLTAHKLFGEIRNLSLDGVQKKQFIDQYEAYLRLQRSVIQMQIDTGYQNAGSNALSAQASMLGSSAAMMNAKLAKKFSKWDLVSSEYDSKEAQRSYEYNTAYFRSPINDRNWRRASSMLPFGAGAGSVSREVHRWARPR